MGTMCAIYGCPVDITADPIEPSSRSLRVTAFQRRLAGIGRLPFATAVLEAEDISPLSITNCSLRGADSLRLGRGVSLDPDSKLVLVVGDVLHPIHDLA